MASDPHDGVTVYRYCEPTPQQTVQSLQRGLQELAHGWRGQRQQQQHGGGDERGDGAAAGEEARRLFGAPLPPPPSAQAPPAAFEAISADAECAEAVGAVPLPLSLFGEAEGGVRQAAAAAGAGGGLRVLLRRHAQHEDCLDTVARLDLREPLVALLPGTLRYTGSRRSGGGSGGGKGAAGQGAAPAAAGVGASGECVVVTRSGGAVELTPLPQCEAALLLALQRALAGGAAVLPARQLLLGGGWHAAFRGLQPLPPYQHPPPTAAVAQRGGEDEAHGAVALADEAAWGQTAAATPDVLRRLAAAEAAEAEAAAEAEVEAAGGAPAVGDLPPPEPLLHELLDGDLLRYFLDLPAEQQAAVAAAVRAGEGGGGGCWPWEPPDDHQEAVRLQRLLAGLLLH